VSRIAALHIDVAIAASVWQAASRLTCRPRFAGQLTCRARHLHPANELLCAGEGGLAVYLPINGIGALDKPRFTLVTAIQGWVWPCSWPVHSYFRQRAVERKRQPMNSEEAEQLAGRSRSRLPPFGRRYAKPPAAALLTGQVARELA